MEENKHENDASLDMPLSTNEVSDVKVDSDRKQIKITVKTASIIAGVVIVLALLFSCRGLFVAAIVNGSPISRLNLIHQLEKNSGKAVLDMIVVQKLISLEAKKHGITVTREEIAAQITVIEGQIAAQSEVTLADMLVSRGMTQGDLEKQIITQLQVEKLIADKTMVTDEEVDQFIAAQRITLKAEEAAEVRTQIAAQLKQEKINVEGNTLVNTLRESAKISYFVDFARVGQ